MRRRPVPPQVAETLPQADVALRVQRRGASPKLPHERDESPSLKVPPDPAVAQGQRDLETGQQDTDAYKKASETFERSRARRPR
jgi:hypothetical protein